MTEKSAIYLEWSQGLPEPGHRNKRIIQPRLQDRTIEVLHLLNA